MIGKYYILAALFWANIINCVWYFSYWNDVSNKLYRFGVAEAWIDDDILVLGETATSWLDRMRHHPTALENSKEIAKIWPCTGRVYSRKRKCVVSYEFHKNLPQKSKYAFLVAASIVTNLTRACVSIQPRKDQPDYVMVWNDTGCYSSVGRTGGIQLLSLNRKCAVISTVLHELFHALGFIHEHNRASRDSFVQINWTNIHPLKQSNFNKNPFSWIDMINKTYDYHSIMHYDSRAFAINRSFPTIIPRQESGLSAGQKRIVTTEDLRALKNLYKCPIWNSRLTDAHGIAY